MVKEEKRRVYGAILADFFGTLHRVSMHFSTMIATIRSTYQPIYSVVGLKSMEQFTLQNGRNRYRSKVQHQQREGQFQLYTCFFTRDVEGYL